MAHSLRISLTLISLLIAVTISQDRLVSMAAPGDRRRPMEADDRLPLHPAHRRAGAEALLCRRGLSFASRSLRLAQGPRRGGGAVILDEVRDLVRLEKDDFVSWNVLNDLSSRNDMRLTVLSSTPCVTSRPT